MPIEAVHVTVLSLPWTTALSCNVPPVDNDPEAGEIVILASVVRDAALTIPVQPAVQTTYTSMANANARLPRPLRDEIMCGRSYLTMSVSKEPGGRLNANPIGGR